MTKQQERTLFTLCLFFVTIVHGVVLYLFIASQFFSSSSAPSAPLKIRLAGDPLALAAQGDLEQMARPDKLQESQTPKKQLQTNQETRFSLNFARRIQNRPPVFSPTKPRRPNKKRPQPPMELPQKTKNYNKPPLEQPVSLSDLSYQPDNRLPSIDFRQNDLLSYIEQERILESIAGQAASVNLDNISSSVQIEVPHGVPLDQLNTIERKFYSFRNRVFRAYVYALLNQAYQSQTPNSPFPFVKRATRLHAKVTFGKKGSLKRVLTLEAGHSPILHRVFIQALKDIRALPNPPKEIIDEHGEFTHGFILEIRN